ncbi:hypothetical protein [Streptomyces sp. NPDC054958]
MVDLGLWLGDLAVLDATVATVPFLWDLSATDSVTSRSGVIELLQTILEHANPPTTDVQHAAHRAVIEGRSAAEVLTRDGNAAVREAARERRRRTPGPRRMSRMVRTSHAVSGAVPA